MDPPDCTAVSARTSSIPMYPSLTVCFCVDHEVACYFYFLLICGNGGRLVVHTVVPCDSNDEERPVVPSSGSKTMAAIVRVVFFAHDYFAVKTRDHEIAIKLNLGRN